MAATDTENTAAVRAHKTTLLTSEGLRQSNIAIARAMFLAGGSYSSYAAATKTEDIAHYRRCLVSAVTNSVQPGAYITALHDLGTGGK